MADLTPSWDEHQWTQVEHPQFYATEAIKARNPLVPDGQPTNPTRQTDVSFTHLRPINRIPLPMQIREAQELALRRFQDDIGFANYLGELLGPIMALGGTKPPPQVDREDARVVEQVATLLQTSDSPATRAAGHDLMQMVQSAVAPRQLPAT